MPEAAVMTSGDYSEVSICNLALQELGRGGQVATMADQTQSGRAVVLRYPYARDACLRAYDWNFAAARIELTENAATPPPFEFANAYDLPADCLKVRALFNGEDCRYKIEGRQLLANFGDKAQILYTKLITDPTKFDPLFTAALAARIAADIAVQLTESSTRTQGLWSVYRQKLAEARTRDAQEGQFDRFPVGSWVESRYQ